MIDFLNIFSKKKPETFLPNLRFGRFSDSYKEEEKYHFWDRAIQAFESDQFLDSFEYFLKYLNDDETKNVEYCRENEKITFRLFQGSKLMTGKACVDRISAEVKIAKTKSYHVGFLRKLISMNYGLKYSRYAIDNEGHITTVFSSSILDCSPYKLYFALKELALNADKQDDILTSEFDELESINTGHLEAIEESEKKIKFDFLQETIKQLSLMLSETKLDQSMYPGGVAYALLSAAYKIDYLTIPEGATMHKLERIHQSFFSQEQKDPNLKNKSIKEILLGLEHLKAEQFYPELYKVKSTFGIAAPSTHENLVSIINGELSNMDWYLKHGYVEFAMAIPTYIIGYSLYNFALPAPDREFMELCYRVTNNSFFVALGYPSVMIDESRLNRKQLLYELRDIVDKYEDQYDLYNPDLRAVVYDNKLFFVKSILELVAKMKLEKSNTMMI